MYSLKVEGVFSSAHNLRGYKGKCEDLHGHNWRVEICVKSKELDKIGMLLDFKYLKKKLTTPPGCLTPYRRLFHPVW